MSNNTAPGGLLGRCLDLLYPRLCLACRRALTHRQQPQICLSCAAGLDYVRNGDGRDNRMVDQLRGRLPIVVALSLLYYATDSVCQSLVHALKYHGNGRVGVQLGRQLGELIAAHPDLEGLDGIVPVPISARRRYARGYNQAEVIAGGLAAVTGLTVHPAALRRTVFRGSQTRRNATERTANASDAFAAGRGDFAGRHLLLVDDVMTTGATLDFCGNALLEAHRGLRLSVATLALTDR